MTLPSNKNKNKKQLSDPKKDTPEKTKSYPGSRVGTWVLSLLTWAHTTSHPCAGREGGGIRMGKVGEVGGMEEPVS